MVGPRRSTFELLVLMLAAAACVVMVVLAGSIAVIEVVNPAVDTSTGITALSAVVSTVLGAVLGLIAGNSTRDRLRAKRRYLDDPPEDEHEEDS